MGDSKLIQFIGTWTEQERMLVAEAAAEFEGKTSLEAVVRGQPPWTCIATCVGKASAYTATRAGLKQVVYARNADDLARVIRRLLKEST